MGLHMSLLLYAIIPRPKAFIQHLALSRSGTSISTSPNILTITVARHYPLFSLVSLIVVLSSLRTPLTYLWDLLFFVVHHLVNAIILCEPHLLCSPLPMHSNKGSHSTLQKSSAIIVSYSMCPVDQNSGCRKEYMFVPILVRLFEEKSGF